MKGKQKTQYQNVNAKEIFDKLDKIIEVNPQHFPKASSHREGGDDFISHRKYNILKKKMQHGSNVKARRNRRR